MIIFKFSIDKGNVTEVYYIRSLMRSHGYRSNYQQVETWYLYCETTNRLVTTAYGKGKQRILSSLNEVKKLADNFTVIQDWQVNPTAKMYSTK